VPDEIFLILIDEIPLVTRFFTKSFRSQRTGAAVAPDTTALKRAELCYDNGLPAGCRICITYCNHKLYLSAKGSYRMSTQHNADRR
ncbi:TPA: hypothetical protein ACQ7EP_005156, partial [Klebsiella pneumoniae]